MLFTCEYYGKLDNGGDQITQMYFATNIITRIILKKLGSVGNITSSKKSEEQKCSFYANFL